MKKLLLTVAIIVVALTSCTSDPEATPAPAIGGINTGNLRLFVIDTAKVNTVSMTGTAETTILNRKVNTNSYIGSFSIKNDGTRFVYADYQGAMVNNMFVDTKTVRVANANGSGDIAIYTAPARTNTVSTEINYVKFGASKIYYSTATQTMQGGLISTVTKLNTVNFDGTGLVSENAPFGGTDITSDGKYIAYIASTPLTNAQRLFIVDRTGDLGAGTTYHTVNIPTSITSFASQPAFSYDDKFVYYAYAENQTLKVAIINMATKTSEIKTIATGFTATSFNLHISVASDNNRGIVVVNGFSSNTAPSKSFVFNLASGTSNSFNNNDRTIYDIYAY